MSANFADLIASNIVWIVYGIYAFGLIPQILLNYRLKNATGISDLMLLGYFLGYLTQIYFVYATDYPSAYRIMIPISLFFVSILVFQRFYYNPETVPRLIKLAYVIALGFAFLFTPFFFKNGPSLGLAFGWVSTSIWCTYQVPQVLKINREKSFNGLSFGFLSLMALAITLELISALILKLELPTIVSCARALVIYGIFTLQFRRYG